MLPTRRRHVHLRRWHLDSYIKGCFPKSHLLICNMDRTNFVRLLINTWWKACDYRSTTHISYFNLSSATYEWASCYNLVRMEKSMIIGQYNTPYYSAYSWFNRGLSTVHYYPDFDLFHSNTHLNSPGSCCHILAQRTNRTHSQRVMSGTQLWLSEPIPKWRHGSGGTRTRNLMIASPAS